MFTPIAKEVRSRFAGAFVTGEYVKAPAKFPHVSIVENDNYEPDENRDSSAIEKYAIVTYKVDVYSNKTTGKKSECKSIAGLIRKMLVEDMGFQCLSFTPTPNLEDSTIYRITAVYTGKTNGTHVYGR